MTGSDVKLSALSDGVTDQFKRNLAAAGLSGDHVRDLMAHKSALEQWVRAGIAAADQLWSERFCFTPTRVWQKIGNSRIVPDREVWARSAEIPYNSNGDLMVEMSYGKPDDDEQGSVYYIHRGYWANYLGGIQMRRTGPDGIEVRFPADSEGSAQTDSDEWEPEYRRKLSPGILTTIDMHVEITIPREHSCFMCHGEAKQVVSLVGYHGGNEDRTLMHLFDHEWHSATRVVQIRASKNTPDLIYIRRRRLQ